MRYFLLKILFRVEMRVLRSGQTKSPLLPYILEMRKNKKQGCCCFCPFKLKTPYCSQSAGQGRTEIKIFVRKGTKKNIGFTCSKLRLHPSDFYSHKETLFIKQNQNIYGNLN